MQISYFIVYFCCVYTELMIEVLNKYHYHECFKEICKFQFKATINMCPLFAYVSAYRNIKWKIKYFTAKTNKRDKIQLKTRTAKMYKIENRKNKALADYNEKI